MGPTIDIEGLKHGKRLRRLSDTARFYYPLLLGSSNGYGRLEIDFDNLEREVFSEFRTRVTQEQFWTLMQEYRDADLLFLYEFGGQIWGQWDVKRGCLPRYQSRRDNESPEPPKAEYKRWVERIRAHSAEQTSKLLLELPKSSENFRGVQQLSAIERKSCVELSCVELSCEQTQTRARESTSNGHNKDEDERQRFELLVQAYPAAGKERLEQAFKTFVAVMFEERQSSGLSSGALMSEMLEGLSRWRASDRWSRGRVHLLKTYLSERLWREHPEPVKPAQDKKRPSFAVAMANGEVRNVDEYKARYHIDD